MATAVAEAVVAVGVEENIRAFVPRGADSHDCFAQGAIGVTRPHLAGRQTVLRLHMPAEPRKSYFETQLRLLRPLYRAVKIRQPGSSIRLACVPPLYSFHIVKGGLEQFAC